MSKLNIKTKAMIEWEKAMEKRGIKPGKKKEVSKLKPIKKERK